MILTNGWRYKKRYKTDLPPFSIMAALKGKHIFPKKPNQPKINVLWIKCYVFGYESYIQSPDGAVPNSVSKTCYVSCSICYASFGSAIVFVTYS